MYDHFESEKTNLVEMFGKAFESGVLFVRTEDGKIGINTAPIWNTPWIVSGRSEDSHYCGYLHGILFKYLNIVPSYCQSCWKVVAKPKTVKQLFDILEYQEKSGVLCKCGIENREFTSGLYGAYWYNRSPEEGMECRDKVRKDMKDIGEFPIYLKRGCTEFERKFPVSIGWQVSEEQKELEKLAADNIVLPTDYIDYDDPWYIRQFVKSKWIAHACRYGDMTYKEFTGGKELSLPTVIYTKAEDGNIQGCLPDYMVEAEE